MFQLHHPSFGTIDVGSQMHVVLKVFKVVTHEVCDDAILLLKLVFQSLVSTLQGKECQGHSAT